MWAVVFLLFPLVELVALIKIGGVIGAVPAVLGVIATSVLGASLLRRKGLRTLLAMQNLAEGTAGADRKLAGELAATLGAALLLFPGYVSDVIGLLLFVPGIGAWVVGHAMRGRQWTVVSSRIYRKHTQTQARGGGRIIEGEIAPPKPRRDWSDDA